MSEPSYSLYHVEKDTLPGLLLLDVGLDPATLSQRYPWLIRISLAIKSPTVAGLCSPEESTHLDDFEDNLLDGLKESEYLYVGRITWNASRDVLLYVEHPNPIIEHFQFQFHRVGGEPIPVIQLYDPYWEEYRALLPK